MARIEQRAELQRMTLPKNTTSGSRTLESDSSMEAFERAFGDNWALIYRLLARMVGDPSEAEDLALEAFYRLYRNDQRGEPHFNTVAWLRRVAVNLGLHSIRSFKRRFTHELEAGTLEIQNAEADSPSDSAAEREMHDLARAALSQLRSSQAELLLMRYSGASYKDIAEALHLSPASIGPLLLRAEREFSKRYRQLGREEA